jgi:PAS domain S-box-containing protein
MGMDAKAGRGLIARRSARRGSTRAASATLAAIIDSSDDAIISKSLDGRVTTWNRSAERIFGYGADEMIGQNISVLIPEERLAEETDILSRLRRGERVDHFETVRRAKDGHAVDVLLTIWPIRDGAGTIVGVSKIARDIGESKRLCRSERSDRAKDHFISILSHELRTPLAPVIMAVQTLAMDRTLHEDQRELIGIIQRNVELEARLIDDLLDLTRISKGKLAMHFAEVDLHHALRDVLRICEGDIREKRLGVSVDFGAREAVVQGDSTRLQQVLWNLLKNAVKFTSAEGAISITTANLTPARLTILISDNGVGIERDALRKIFEPFEQGEKSRTRQFGGLGLGLSISNGIMELHGGTLSAESAGKGQGATFAMLLPTHAPQALPPRPAAARMCPIGANPSAFCWWKIMRIPRC